jgi:hypothetical protein
MRGNAVHWNRDMALTAEEISERIMASHAKRTAPVEAVFFGSGNNMLFVGDMARRVVLIDLAPTQERPDERDDFTHPDLLEWVMEQRPRLVRAALTIIKAYLDAGSPKQTGLNPFGSYEPWSNLIRHSLVWVGQTDPCEGRHRIEAEHNPRYEQQKVVLSAWYERYQDTPHTINEVIDDLNNHHVELVDERGWHTGKWIIDPAWRPLHAALMSLNRKTKDLDATSVGYAFRGWTGRVIGDLRLKRLDDQQGGSAVWQVLKEI